MRQKPRPKRRRTSKKRHTNVSVRRGTTEEAFPYRLDHVVVTIRGIRQFKVVSLARADLPPIQIEARPKAWLANRTVPVRGEWDPGILDADVQLTARGIAAPRRELQRRSPICRAQGLVAGLGAVGASKKIVERSGSGFTKQAFEENSLGWDARFIRGMNGDRRIPRWCGFPGLDADGDPGRHARQESAAQRFLRDRRQDALHRLPHFGDELVAAVYFQQSRQALQQHCGIVEPACHRAGGQGIVHGLP